MIKDQLIKLKENWLMILVIVVVLGVFTMSGSSNSISQLAKGYDSIGYAEEGYAVSSDMAIARSSYYPGGGDFAPEVEERKITKTASLSSEVERGTYSDAETKLKAILTSSDSFLLNENVNKYGKDKKAYLQGYYSVKVETDKYDAVIAQLKEIGEVISFSESATDITGTYVDVEGDLEVERERLTRYKALYEEAKEIEDKISLSDRIANQERTIKYYEDRLNNLDKRVDYSTVSVSLKEEQSNYANVVFVKFSELIKGFVNSINSVIKLVIVVIPWAVLAWIIWFISRRFKKRQ